MSHHGKGKEVKGSVPLKAEEMCTLIESMGCSVRLSTEKRDEIKKCADSLQFFTAFGINHFWIAKSTSARITTLEKLTQAKEKRSITKEKYSKSLIGCRKYSVGFTRRNALHMSLSKGYSTTGRSQVNP